MQKVHKTTIYLDEEYKKMIEEIKKELPQLSVNDIVRLAIKNFYKEIKK